MVTLETSQFETPCAGSQQQSWNRSCNLYSELHAKAKTKTKVKQKQKQKAEPKGDVEVKVKAM